MLIGLDSTADNMARSAHQFQEISRDVRDEQKVKDRALHFMPFYFNNTVSKAARRLLAFLLSRLAGFQ